MSSQAVVILLLVVVTAAVAAAVSPPSSGGVGGSVMADIRSFPLQTGLGFTEAGYVQFIQSIRDHIKSKTSSNQPARAGATVLPTAAQAKQLRTADQFFFVVLTNDVPGRQVTVAVRLQNLGVVAYKYKTYYSYFFSDEFPASVFFFFPSVKTRLSYAGSYASLRERAGAGRDSIELGNWALARTVDVLANLNGTVDDRVQARAFTVITQMVSEAVRFQSVLTQVSRATSEDFVPSASLIELENNWAELSSAGVIDDSCELKIAASGSGEEELDYVGLIRTDVAGSEPQLMGSVSVVGSE